MANRTVQMLGYVYTADPATITATVNGVQVFSGPVTTVGRPNTVPDPARTGEVLFTFEIPVYFAGTMPVSIVVADQAVAFMGILANYGALPRITQDPSTGLPVYGNPYQSSGATNFIPIYDPAVEADTIFDERTNVTIDGVAQTISPENRAQYNGTWGWSVQPGQTLAFDMLVTGGLPAY